MNTAVVFAIIKSVSDVGMLVVPVLAWEGTLALWLIVKGFNSSRTASQSAITEIARDEVNLPAA